ncbi:MAG: response regulator [Proteobacteria bacterium]|nr:response regulator [Pseudomonadota bacterium]
MKNLNLTKSKILAIDDNPDNLVVIQALLRNLLPGCNLITASSGNDGILKAMTEKPDVILLDIIMPVMDGYETCEKLKSDPVTSPIPIIMITAVAKDPSCRIKGLEKGADAFIAKPIDAQELIAQVKVALRIKYAEDRLRRERDHLEESVFERTMDLERLKESYRDVVENLPVGICILKKGRMMYINPEYQRLTHTSRNSEKLSDHLSPHPDDAEKTEIFFSKIIEDEPDTDDISFRFHKHIADGSRQVIWVQSRAASVYYNGEKATLLSMMDITRTKELEHLLAIEDKMSSLGRVAAGIAHEIRNPLSSIYINMTLLEKSFYKIGNLPDKIYDHMSEGIREVNVAARRIDKVINRVMDFSKPGALELKRTQIKNCITDAVKLTSVAVRKADVKIQTVLKPELPECYLDALSVTQVFINLITNAIEAMKGMETGKEIHIAASNDNAFIHATITDSGPGISEHERDNIFDPFYTTSESGSGIGLCICRRIVNDHGGKIILLPKENQGARFMISFPLNRKTD